MGALIQTKKIKKLISACISFFNKTYYHRLRRISLEKSKKLKFYDRIESFFKRNIASQIGNEYLLTSGVLRSRDCDAKLRTKRTFIESHASNVVSYIEKPQTTDV